MSFLNCIILTFMLGFGFGFNRILPKLGNGSDPDALEFIANWELSTGVIMPLTQRMAVNDWYRGMKGEGTPHGNDLLSIAKANGTKIFIMIPLDDTTASAEAYKLDAVSNGVFQGDYVNFVSGDFTANGVVGGTGKYFDPSVNLDVDYVTNYGFGIYSRTDQIAVTIDAGQNGANYIFTQLLDNITRSRIGSTSDLNFTSINGTGLIGVQTTNFKRQGINNVNFTSEQSYTKGTFTVSGLLFHAFNLSSPSLFSTRSLSFYYAGMSYMSSSQRIDFYTVIQRLQSNVITGGRQIGTSIPPI